MVEDLLSPTLPLDVKRLVSERSEGNPLYAEEIVRMLIDRGVLRATEASRWELAQPLAEVEVPRSIHALIAARLDTLPAAEKRVLQDAAVAGRIFWLGAAAQLSERPADEVRDALGRLRVKEIVTPREPSTFSGDLEFAFRHVLIRDVAYESLPKLLRAKKHVDVARWAEERAGDRSEELAEVVGAHYLQAIEYREELGEPTDRQLDGAGATWAWEAGRRASSLLQQEAALRWFTAALRLADRSGTDEERLAGILEAVAISMDGLLPFEQVAVAYRSALDRYLALDMDSDAGRMEAALGDVAFKGGDHAKARLWLERGIARLEPHGDGPALARALEILGNYHRRRGEMREAEPLLRRSAEMASRAGMPVVEGHAAISLAIVLLHHGQVKEGIATIERAFEIAMGAGDLELQVRTSNALASCLMDYAPDYERGRRVLMAGIELSQRSGRRDFESWLWSNVANYAFDQGRIDEIERAGRMCLEVGAALSQPYGTAAGNLSLGQAAFLRGELDTAQRHADAAVEAMDPHEEVQAAPYQLLLHGWIARARGDEEAALQRFLDALEIVGDRSMLGMADELLSETIRTLVRMGRRDEIAPYLEGLRIVAQDRPNAEGQQWWAEGIVATDPAEREARLSAAVERFHWLTRRLDEARCLLDLADSGVDTSTNVERARAVFAECGAEVYLREIDART
jgi:tetratricopeptide (TPR) repeat protein